LVDELTVKLNLDNFVQLDQLNSFKPDLLRFLRHRVNNSGLALEAVITPQEDVKMIYTSNDKFKYLSEKYPILEEMKKKFGLDTDF
jgi:DNA polymerase-3 subunit gamma/tau